jgi:hypothetical protein
MTLVAFANVRAQAVCEPVAAPAALALNGDR